LLAHVKPHGTDEVFIDPRLQLAHPVHERQISMRLAARGVGTGDVDHSARIGARGARLANERLFCHACAGTPSGADRGRDLPQSGLQITSRRAGRSGLGRVAGLEAALRVLHAGRGDAAVGLRRRARGPSRRRILLARLALKLVIILVGHVCHLQKQKRPVLDDLLRMITQPSLGRRCKSLTGGEGR
jgi:hypothetical protein